MRNILFHFSTSSPCVYVKSQQGLFEECRVRAPQRRGAGSDPYLAYPPQLLLLFFVDAFGYHPLAQRARVLRPLVQDQCRVVVEVIHTAVAPEPGDRMLPYDMVPIPRGPGQMGGGGWGGLPLLRATTHFVSRAVGQALWQKGWLMYR